MNTGLGGNLTQATFLSYIDRYVEADNAVAAALGTRKALRAEGKEAGLNLNAVDRARKEAAKDIDTRDQDDRDFRRYIGWLGKPLGYQADWVAQIEREAQPNGPDSAISEHQVHQVSNDGHMTGLAGRERISNPWGAGTYLSQIWDSGWLSGQEKLAQQLLPAEPRRRGRPRKEAS